MDQRSLFLNVSNTYLAIKRLLDIIAALGGLILLSPLMLVTAVAIKLDSPGPVIFSQERNGFRGRVFKMYKFRSMVTDAEQLFTHLESKNEVSGQMFKIRNDPRITRVGKIIRKTSIDELPQLFNVLKGEMSLVGPRPPIVREVVKYEAWHSLRLSVKPGLTGLWQISGRNDLGFEEMVRLDMKYIRERSLKYDLKIILKTIPVLLGDSRAF
ncbi:MAG: sugar transferase [Clostridiales bacterium]|nr:sugar transferase [Eubacteriales bacterium]MDH7566515.1 sugar transferase [Clostridiales bacterium]